MPSMDTLPPYRAPNYIVWRDGSWYRALNGVTGEIENQSLDPGACVIAAFTAGGAGCVVELKEDTFTAIAFSFAFTANNQWLRGSGDGTFLDCDALLTGVHGITLNGHTGCTVSDFSIQTEDGAGKTCYCVWIANGADGFHVMRVTVINSDSHGITVMGTTISQGHIHHCHVVAADAVGIYVDMDAVNFMYRLHVEDCDVGNCGAQGIFFAASGGNNYCEVINNIVYSCTLSGIRLDDGNYSQVRGNISILNTGNGINLRTTLYTQVLGNISYSNTLHGIYLLSSAYCTVEANHCLENDSGDTATYDGINVDGDSTRNMVLGNMCVGNHRYGVYVLGAGNSVNSNTCAENDQHGILLNATECKANDNLCYHNGADANNSYDGIALAAAADRCTVNGNTCYGDGTRQRHGILLEDGAIDCTVNGNICYNNATDGIRLVANNDYISLIGNRCTGNTGWGINILAATCDKCIVVGCGLLGNVAGPLQDNGTLTEAAHNIVA